MLKRLAENLQLQNRQVTADQHQVTMAATPQFSENLIHADAEIARPLGKILKTRRHELSISGAASAGV